MTTRQIYELHKKYALHPDTLRLVWQHCHIVNQIAQSLIRKRSLSIDSEMVMIGCLVHDIGAYRLFDNKGEQLKEPYVRHGILGHEILNGEGLNNRICRFASCHTGMGLSKSDIMAQGLPLPLNDYNAITVEESLVMYADKFHSKTEPSVFNSFEYYMRRLNEYGEAKQSIFLDMSKKFGIPDIHCFAQKYKQKIRI